jgi:hypothetical protein
VAVSGLNLDHTVCHAHIRLREVGRESSFRELVRHPLVGGEEVRDFRWRRRSLEEVGDLSAQSDRSRDEH